MALSNQKSHEYSSFDVCSDNEVAYLSRDSPQGHYQVKDIRECINSGLDYWTGLLDWTTGLTFDPKIEIFTCKVFHCESRSY